MNAVELANLVRIQSPTADPQRPALVPADHLSRTITHHELAVRVAAVAAELPPAASGRRLVQVPLVAEPDVIIGYLAVLLAGHVALVTPERADSIVDRYRPDLRLRADGGFDTLAPGAQHLLHPDLAVLLSTSGSTGSPKLVRLSQENVLSNAEAIVEALAVTPADRAITSLPLHYCFGLSVLHAQLRAGATLVLRTRSCADPDLGDTLIRERVTLIAVTPHLVDLLDVSGVLGRDLPDLRLLAQAGGALPPDRVLEVAGRGRAAGWSLAVMYGQTEATARMAVLPPASVPTHPDAVGWPVAGSSFRLDTSVAEPGGGEPQVGELVFSGPGVMLGYAEHPDDLALGRMQQELRTGDLGHMDPDGLVRVVGRRADFAKIMGLRVDLGRIERQLRTGGVAACVTADGDTVQVTYELGDDLEPQRVRELVSTASGLGPSTVAIRGVPALPRLSNGKLDHMACAAAWLREARPAARLEVTAGGPADLAAVAAALGPLLGRTSLDPDRSFVELGGDSFSHVQASLRLGRLLGDLPPDWHHRPLRELPASGRQVRRRGLGQRVETNVLLRAVAVVMICGSHVDLFPLAGGAHVLLAVAGFTFGRYVLSQPSTAQRWQRTAQAAVAIAVPAVLVAAVMAVVFGSARWAHVALLHWALHPATGNVFWFVEALLVIMLTATALLSVESVRTAYAADPWRVSFLAMAALLVPRYLVLALVEGPVRGLPGTVAWLFAAGLAMVTAQTTSRRVLTGAVAAAATVGYFPAAERNLVIMAGLVLLALVPTVVVPHVLLRPVGALAAASLHVYLVQFQVFTFFSNPVLKFGAALLTGLVLWALTSRLLRHLQCQVPLVRSRLGAGVIRTNRKELLCVDGPS